MMNLIEKPTRLMKWLSLYAFGSCLAVVFTVIIYGLIPHELNLQYREMINLSIYLGILISVTTMYLISRKIKVKEDKYRFKW